MSNVNDCMIMKKRYIPKNVNFILELKEKWMKILANKITIRSLKFTRFFYY